MVHTGLVVQIDVITRAPEYIDITWAPENNIRPGWSKGRECSDILASYLLLIKTLVEVNLFYHSLTRKVILYCDVNGQGQNLEYSFILRLRYMNLRNYYVKHCEYLIYCLKECFYISLMKLWDWL